LSSNAILHCHNTDVVNIDVDSIVNNFITSCVRCNHHIHTSQPSAWVALDTAKCIHRTWTGFRNNCWNF